MSRDLNAIIDELEIREQVELMDFYKEKKENGRRIDFEQTGFPKLSKDIKIIDPKDNTLAGNFIYVSKNTLPEIKKLVGVSDDILDNNKRAFGKVMDETDLESLPMPERAVRMLTCPLTNKDSRSLINFTGQEELEAFIKNAADQLPVFIADEMIVKEGEMITVKDTVVLIFRHLQIHKLGKIDFCKNYYTKIVTQTLSE